MKSGKVISVNISQESGQHKKPVESSEIHENGIQDDFHARRKNKQVSLLAIEAIRSYKKDKGSQVEPGEYGENITTEGIALRNVFPLDRLIIGEVELEVTQIGKKYKGGSVHAAKKDPAGCIMHQQGVFARVVKSGHVRTGDKIEHFPKIYSIHVITLSDRAFAGEYHDQSGPRVIELVSDFLKSENKQFEFEHTIIPDDPEALRVLLDRVEDAGIDMVITTGGTGIGPRDNTPEVVKDMLDKEIPGVMEAIRMKYGLETPNALLSRGVAGVLGTTLVYTLPGSVRAVEEYLGEIFKTVNHTIQMIHGLDSH